MPENVVIAAAAARALREATYDAAGLAVLDRYDAVLAAWDGQ